GRRNAELWSENVYRTLIRITTTQTGSIVCDAMTERSFNLYVRPTLSRPHEAEIGPNTRIDVSAWQNTEAIPVNQEGATPKGVTRVLAWNGRVVEGNGAGSDSVVRFCSHVWAARDPQRRLLPEDVLLHEMCHSLRQMRGQIQEIPM